MSCFLLIIFSDLYKPVLKFLPFWGECLPLLDINQHLQLKWAHFKNELPIRNVAQLLQYKQYMFLPTISPIQLLQQHFCIWMQALSFHENWLNWVSIRQLTLSFLMQKGCMRELWEKNIIRLPAKSSVYCNDT